MGMKQLQTEFIKNVDMVGDQKFVQLDINTERTHAIYKRLVMHENSRVFGFEVINIKTRLKGQPLPGGSVEAEDREVYPGAKSFGKIGWFFVNEQSARNKYKELIESHSNAVVAGLGPTRDVTPKVRVNGTRRGRERKYGTTLSIPPGEFTVRDLMDIHQEPQPTIYLKLQAKIRAGEIKEVGSKPNSLGRGKPTKIYATV